MSNFEMPEQLKDNEEFKSFIKNTFTYVSANKEREIFTRLLKGMLTGDIDKMLSCRDDFNVYLNKECDTYEEERG